MNKIGIYIFLLLFCIQMNTLFSYAETTDTNTHKNPDLTGFVSQSNSFTARKYVLGPNDVISILVFDNPDFNQEKMRIQPDGKLVLAHVGAIDVTGMTVEELKNLLVQKFKFYINDPEITIKMDEIKPFIIYVSGAVLNPGSYELSTDTSAKSFQSLNPNKLEVQIDRKTPLLSNILVAAGGISYDADLEHVQITNSVDNSKFEVNLLELLQNGGSSQDIYLMSGDNVYVPKLPTPFAVSDEKYKKYASATFSPKSVPVRVFGYVNQPGLVRLDPAQSLSLNSAIVSAGGYQSNAAYAPKKVYVSRVDASGKLVTKVVNPMSKDIALMPNDIIYVPEKIRPLTGKAFDFISRVILPASEFASSYNNWALMFNPTRYQVIGK